MASVMRTEVYNFKPQEILDIDDDGDSDIDQILRRSSGGALRRPAMIHDDNGPLNRFGKRKG